MSTQHLVYWVGSHWLLHVGNVAESCFLLALSLAYAPLWFVVPMAAMVGASLMNLVSIIVVRRDARKLGLDLDSEPQP